MTIFYFTATGNSLEVAKAIGGTTLSIPAVMKGSKREFADDVIGIVCPNYHGDIPAPVQSFLQSVRLKADYLFGVITYGESIAKCVANLQKHGEQCGISFDYLNRIKMVDNSFVYFNVDKQVRNLHKKRVPEHLKAICHDIEKRRRHLENPDLSDKLIAFITTIVPADHDYASHFSVEEDKCVKCGTCVKACPLDNVSMPNYPVIGNKCIRCGACTHNCPKNAIRYSGEKSRARYRNASIKLSEIIKANNTIYVD